jgi:hypothetical protein
LAILRSVDLVRAVQSGTLQVDSISDSIKKMVLRPA